jgi:hypothetical protein
MYTHQKEHYRVSGITLSATGEKGRFSPGIRPFVLRTVVLTLTTMPTATAPVLTIRHRAVAGTGAGTVVDTITVPLTRAAGDVIYCKGLNQRVEPGQDIQFDLTTAGTGGVADLAAEFDPAWDQLTNRTNAYETV